MKVENFEKAEKLIKELNYVQMKLDTLVDERERCLRIKETEESIYLFDTKELFEVDIKVYQACLMEMITAFQIQKDELTAQIDKL